jgi:hypothetical protein
MIGLGRMGASMDSGADALFAPPGRLAPARFVFGQGDCSARNEFGGHAIKKE